MAAGIILLAAAILLTGYNLWDDRRAGDASAAVLADIPDHVDDDTEGNIPAYILNPDMEIPVLIIDGNEYIGTVEIPALDLKLPVMSSWSLEKLRIAPCRYAGTAYKSGFVIAGHNYQAHFSGIKSLSSGSEIRFSDIDGNCFKYEVVRTEVLGPTEVEKMTDDAWDLTLFTCTYGGGSRYTVRCMKIEE